MQLQTDAYLYCSMKLNFICLICFDGMKLYAYMVSSMLDFSGSLQNWVLS